MTNTPAMVPRNGRYTGRPSAVPGIALLPGPDPPPGERPGAGRIGRAVPRPDRLVGRHLHDELEPTDAERGR